MTASEFRNLSRGDLVGYTCGSSGKRAIFPVVDVYFQGSNPVPKVDIRDLDGSTIPGVTYDDVARWSVHSTTRVDA